MAYVKKLNKAGNSVDRSRATWIYEAEAEYATG